MSLCRLSPEFVLGGFTPVDNVFLCEYMRDAPENYVRVYLYGLYLSHCGGRENSIADFSAALKLGEGEVLAAFQYWNELGLCNLLSESPIEVVYVPVSITSKPRKIKAGKYTEFNKQLQALLPARMITPTEFAEYYNVMESFHVQPEAMIMIVKYCVDLKGESVSYRYVLTVARNFATRHITTLSAVEEELSGYVRQSGATAELVRAMGSRRRIEIEDNDYYKRWTQELGFDHKTLLFVASNLQKGSNMKAFDATLKELYAHRLFTQEEIARYRETKAALRELAYAVNRALGIYYELVDTEIERYIVKWLDKGFTHEALIRIAVYCEANGMRQLDRMGETVDKFAKLGLFTVESIEEYVRQALARDERIAKMLEILGIDRRVNRFDRESFRRWSVSWGFTDEVILYAAEISAGSAHPLQYMNVVLSKWRANDVFSLEAAKEFRPETGSAPDKKPADLAYVSRDPSQAEAASLFASLDDVDF